MASQQEEAEHAEVKEAEAEGAAAVVVRVEVVEEYCPSSTLVSCLWADEGLSVSLEVFLPRFFWRRAE